MRTYTCSCDAIDHKEEDVSVNGGQGDDMRAASYMLDAIGSWEV